MDTLEKAIVKQQGIKRVLDVLVMIVLLPIASFLLVFFWVVGFFIFKGKPLYKQARIGRYAKPFMVYKFRTIAGDENYTFTQIEEKTKGYGRFLRKTKLDELPQLIQVIIGTMSFVGPRPDVAGYADQLEGENKMILLARPGLTGPATIYYRNEDTLLRKQKNPKEYNDVVIWPHKVKMNLEYLKNWNLMKDVRYIWSTIR